MIRNIVLIALLLGLPGLGYADSGIAHLLTPANNSQVAGYPPVQFTWTGVSDAISYTLWVGTQPNTYDVLYLGTTSTSTSALIPPGMTLYVTLWTRKSSGYYYENDTFSTAPTAYLTAPGNGTTGVNPTVQTFTWTSVPNVIWYELRIGTSPGASDVYNSWDVTVTTLNLNLNLQPNFTYYARLFTDVGGAWSYTDSTFTTGTVTKAYLTLPGNGATGVDPRVQTFAWNSVPNDIWYELRVGTSPGASDVYNSWDVTVTTLNLNLNLQSNFTYYVRLFTDVGGAWTSTESTFTTGTGIAHLLTPKNGSQIPGYPSVQFSWNSVADALDYVVWVGTASGKNDVLYKNTNSTSISAPMPPGMTLYVRLFTQKSSGWYYEDDSFSTTPTAYLTSPPNGATGVDPTVPITFTWTSVPQVIWYTLWVGTSPGIHDIYDSYGVTTATLSVNANWQSNTKYYVRLFTDVAGSWTYSDTTFSTGTGIARLQTPVNGAIGVSQFQKFTWNQVSDALLYTLIVTPTNYGIWDMFGDVFQPTVAGHYVWGLLPNTYYYASICTQKVPGWTCSNSNFTTGPAGPLPDRQQFYRTVQSFTSQVRLMTYGLTPKAIPGTALYQESLDHGEDPNEVTCGIFAATLLDDEMTPNNILGRARGISIDGLDGHVIAEYWDPFNNKWQIADATFGLVYFNPQTEVGQGAEDVNTLLEAGDLSDIDTLWVTGNGSQYMKNYYLDPITMYNEVYPFGDIESGPLEINYLPNSPLPFMNSQILGNVQGVSGVYVFQFANQTDQITVNNAGTLVKITPGNTDEWAVAINLWTGWYVTSQVPSGLNVYTFKRLLF